MTMDIRSIYFLGATKYVVFVLFKAWFMATYAAGSTENGNAAISNKIYPHIQYHLKLGALLYKYLQQ